MSAPSPMSSARRPDVKNTRSALYLDLKTRVAGAEVRDMRTGITTHWRHALRQDAADRGLTLIEVMVAMVIFAVVAAGVVAGLSSALKTARLDKNRVAASNLAAREAEIVRNEFYASSTGPTTLAATPTVVNPHQFAGQTAGQPLKVDGVPYTVTRDVEWLPAGSGKTACDGGAAITYPTLSVTVTVSWPNMSGVNPVSTSTILTPKKGTLSSNLSFVGVKVLDASGLPASGLQVTLSGPGGTSNDNTSVDGCAVFSVNTTGTYNASMNTSGYVDFYGSTNPSKSVVVNAGTLSQLTFNYDKAARLDVTLQTATGYALPTARPGITLANTGLQPSGVRTLASSGVTTPITTLWPFPDGYTVWSGTCTASDPASQGGARSSAVVVSPGGSATTVANLTPVDIHAQRSSGVARTNATILAVPVPTTGCVSPETSLTLGVTNSTGDLKTSLPAGDWQIQVSGRTPSPSWPTLSDVHLEAGPMSVTAVTT